MSQDFPSAVGFSYEPIYFSDSELSLLRELMQNPQIAVSLDKARDAANLRDKVMHCPLRPLKPDAPDAQR